MTDPTKLADLCEVAEGEMPRFANRAELLEWSQEQVRQFQLDAPYARNQARLMLTVADRIKRVTLANAAILEELP